MQVLQKSWSVAEVSNPSGQTRVGRANNIKLIFYDLWSLQVTAKFAWNCPTRTRIQFYSEYVSANHLDVGPASGYLLNRCRFPMPKPRLALLDVNAYFLAAGAARLERYHPILLNANVLHPMDWSSSGFDSIGVNYLLHCLPGSMREKGAIFQNLKVFMNRGCTVFGTTILGNGVVPGIFGRRLLEYYNSRHHFHNYEDSLDELDAVLGTNFDYHKVWKVGMVAFFVAH